MNRRDDAALLSALIDGELSASDEEQMRRRLASDPELAAELAKLRLASDVSRSFFESSEGALPDLRGSRDDFIRTTLGGSPMGSEVPLASWWCRPMVRWLGALMLLIGIVMGLEWMTNGGAAAVRFSAAAEAVLTPKNGVSVVITRPALLGDGSSVHLLCGRSGRWVVEARGSVVVPGALAGGGSSPVRVRHEGKIHLGSDGNVIWLWVEGEGVVRVLAAPSAPSGLTFFRRLLDETSDGQQGLLLNWGRLQDLLEGVAYERLPYRRMGKESVSGERMQRYDVTLADGAIARVWCDLADGAIRRVHMGLLTLLIDAAREPPSASQFEWRSKAPADVRVERVG